MPFLLIDSSNSGCAGIAIPSQTCDRRSPTVRHTARVPELPEVETIRRQLEPLVVAHEVIDAWAFDSTKFTPALDAVGGRINDLRRRGKYLIAGLTPPTDSSDPLELVVHLGMTGRLAVTPVVPAASGEDWRQPDVDPYLRAGWLLRRTDVERSGGEPSDVERSGDDGSQPGSLSFLSYSDVRRFGRIAVVEAGEYGELPTLATLGPEPFDDTFTPEGLRSALNGSRRAVKTQLLSQRVVAGVGNIYADEALWHAQVHPAAKRITRRQAQDLRDSIRAVLWSGITHGGTTLRDYRDASGSEGSNQHQLVCYGRVGKPCHRCGSPLRRLVVDARSSTFCGQCQRR